MRRTTLQLCLPVALSILALSCTGNPAPPTSPSVSADARGEIDKQQRPVTYAVIGDVPYAPFADATTRFPTLIDALNADPAVERVIHVGDIKAGSTVCSDSAFQAVAAQFTTFTDPLVYAIGDNEWTDCHRANNGGYNPLDRLAKIRELFFANPGFTREVSR